MVLAFLVGNSNLRLQLSEAGGEPRIADSIPWREWDARRAEWTERLQGLPVSAAIAGSVRDDLLEGVEAALPAGTGPIQRAGVDFPLPIENRYERPAEVGIDRLLNAVAAARRARRDAYGGELAGAARASIVVDFGSALSISVVGADGAFLGGLITAGDRALLDGLHLAAPRLPRVEAARPGGFLERTTRQNIESGSYWAMVGAVRTLLEGMVRELSSREPLQVAPLILATGGGASRFAADVPAIGEVVPDLTFEGLHAAYNARPQP